MAHIVSLSASILIQDDSVTPPAEVAKDSKTDQQTDHDEYMELAVTVAPSASDQTIDLSTPGISCRTLFIKTDQPVTMKQGASSFAQPIRSIFCATYESGNAPASLKFSNASSTLSAKLKIILGSKN